MLDDAVVLATCRQMNEALNAGDMDAFASFLADGCTAMASDTFLGSREEFVAAIKNGRAAGWTGQQTVEASARSNLLMLRAYNTFADGSRTDVVGIVRFNDNAKVIAVRSLNATGISPVSKPKS